MKTNLPLVLVLTAALLAPLSCDEGVEPEMCEIGCPEGLGFPCPCNPDDGCSEGSVCGAVSEIHQVGFCSIPCEKDSDCAWEADCTGKRRCILENETSGGMNCALTCRSNKDCPLNMSCAEVDGLKVCYPWTY